MQVSTGRKTRAQKVVLYGPEGIGKTSLAAAFPDPLFIDCEDGTAAYDVRRAEPAPTSWAMLLQYVEEVKAGAAPCSTLVIDTADAAERLCASKVCADKGWSGIEDAGYGKGYKVVNEEFGRLLDRLSDVAERGVNVVLCAHARISKFEQPDEAGAYDRWSMKLIDTPRASNAALCKEWADLVLFLNYETYVVKSAKEDGGKRKAQGGKRMMYAQHHAVWDAKNRVGLPERMPLDYGQIAAHIPDMRAAGAVSGPSPAPSMKQAATRPQAETEPAPVSNPATAPSMKQPATRTAVEAGGLEFEEVAPGQPAPGAAAPAPDAVPGDAPAHLRPLYDLMAASGASEADVTGYAEGRGWMAKGTPLAAYPAEAVGWLVANWATVGKDIPTPIK